LPLPESVSDVPAPDFCTFTAPEIVPLKVLLVEVLEIMSVAPVVA